MANGLDEDVRAEFCHIQRKICTVLTKDVLARDGLFHAGLTPPTNREIELRYMTIGDLRPHNTLEGVRTFPPKPWT